jgi:hypothetical protein
MSHTGRARVSTRNPQAFGVCDRCAIWYNLVDLSYQYDWAGASIQNKQLLVCPSCKDEFQDQLRAIVLPADPVPVMNPRTEPFAYDETNNRFTSGLNSTDPSTGIPVIGGNNRITIDDDDRVTQTTGEPPGGLNERPGTDPNAPGNDDPGLPINFNEVPKTGPLT